jgi:urea transport system permease protein
VAPGLAAPNFMNYTNLPVTHPDYHPPAALPFIAPLANIWVALAAAILIPMLVAALFGLMTFRLRIRGVYFSLITQALLLAVYMLVMDQQRYTGGFVGLKDLADLQLFGITFDGYGHAKELYYLTLGVLLVCLVGCALLMASKFGKILTAIRDNENRVRALGYNPGMYKLFIFTLAGGLAGLAGALFTAANGLCGTQYLSVAYSINAVVLVAVGGRGTLFGAVLGAILVSTAEFQISAKYENYWPIFLGSLFVICVLFLPDGILGGLRRLSLLAGKGFRKVSPEAR